MSTFFTHAVIGASLTPLAGPVASPTRLSLTLAFVAVMPDLDMIGYHCGVPYEHPFGHRGFSHSFFFAAVSGLLAAQVLFPGVARFTASWWRLVAVISLATASHGILDALTDSGRGIGFLLPFWPGRYFSPWRPLPTPSGGIQVFFEHEASHIMPLELLWVWAPLCVWWLCVLIVRRQALTGHRREGGT